MSAKCAISFSVGFVPISDESVRLRGWRKVWGEERLCPEAVDLNSLWDRPAVSAPTHVHARTHTHTHSTQPASQFMASPWGVRWDQGSMELFTVCLLGPNSLAQRDWRCPSQPWLSVLILSRCRRRAPWTPGGRRPTIRSFTGGKSPPHLP